MTCRRRLDPARPPAGEEAQPAVWMRLERRWESCLPEDRARIRRYARVLMKGGAL
ncbi:hypothetical protein KGA66_04995 [Actinocrinis puniceicyclus]|uniref:Uncharacterized protein n=1 Tax=Actinocrinis puniceicyclus TaxID=977794 RepID=A0A8J8BBS5_9ACTN|nr:hypothetical protein [Actinocrinis puniceicyclus]MBS2962391.1 hypothetical protein [Actinocrinis puniceicyclus]